MLPKNIVVLLGSIETNSDVTIATIDVGYGITQGVVGSKDIEPCNRFEFKSFSATEASAGDNVIGSK